MAKDIEVLDALPGCGKTHAIFNMLKEGKNIACTHNLMLRFQDRHIEKIIKHSYRVVCDEELNLMKDFYLYKGGYTIIEFVEDRE